MKVKTETITRTIILALALINQILAVLGKGSIDIADSTIYQIVSIIITVVAAGRSWWKNNSFTAAALRADEIMEELKIKDSKGEKEE